MSDSETTLHFSVVSLWEVRLKWSKGIGGETGFPDPSALARYADAVGWTMLKIEPRHVLAILDKPVEHKDPFDELLLAQAQVEWLKLLTRDSEMCSHPLAYDIKSS